MLEWQDPVGRGEVARHLNRGDRHQPGLVKGDRRLGSQARRVRMKLWLKIPNQSMESTQLHVPGAPGYGIRVLDLV